MEEKYEGNDNAFNNNRIRPKKCMSTKCVETKSKIRQEHDVDNDKSKMHVDANNNKFKALACDDEREEENIMRWNVKGKVE